MDRLQRKKIKHDELVDSTLKIFQYLEDHPKPFIYGVVGLVLAVVGGWAVVALVRTWSGKASDRLAQGMAALDAPLAGTSPARPDDPYRPVYSSTKERGLQAAERLARAARSNGTTGNVAEYLRGAALLEAGEPAQAVDALEKAVERLKNDLTLAGPAKAVLAQAYDRAGSLDKAAQTWRELAGQQSGYPRDVALAELGRTLERAGKRDEAKTVLKELLDLYPNSPMAADARASLNQLGA